MGGCEEPLGREADAVGPGVAPLPQLLEQGGAALPCYSPRAVLCKGPGFIYHGDKGYMGPSLPSFFSKSTPSGRDPHPPHVEPLHLCVAACHLQVTSPQGFPIYPFPTEVEQGYQRGTCVSVHSSRYVTISRRKASSCSQLPHSQRSPESCSAVQDRSLVRAPTKPALLLPVLTPPPSFSS